MNLHPYIATHGLVTAQQVADAFGLRVRVARELLKADRGLVGQRRGAFGAVVYGVREVAP